MDEELEMAELDFIYQNAKLNDGVDVEGKRKNGSFAEYAIHSLTSMKLMTRDKIKKNTIANRVSPASSIDGSTKEEKGEDIDNTITGNTISSGSLDNLEDDVEKGQTTSKSDTSSLSTICDKGVVERGIESSGRQSSKEAGAISPHTPNCSPPNSAMKAWGEDLSSESSNKTGKLKPKEQPRGNQKEKTKGKKI